MKKQYYDHLFKLILVGDSGVGKSSMISKFTEHTFDENHLLTIGVEFKVKTIKIDSKIIKLNIWDTGGLERFKSITSAYYKGIHAILFVFDITNYQSFDNIKMWMNEIKRYTSEDQSFITILIGNKIDLDESKYEVSIYKIQEFCENYNINYIETSAKKGINIEYIFEHISRELKEKDSYILDYFQLQNQEVIESHQPNNCCCRLFKK